MASQTPSSGLSSTQRRGQKQLIRKFPTVTASQLAGVCVCVWCWKALTQRALASIFSLDFNSSVWAQMPQQSCCCLQLQFCCYREKRSQKLNVLDISDVECRGKCDEKERCQRTFLFRSSATFRLHLPPLHIRFIRKCITELLFRPFCQKKQKPLEWLIQNVTNVWGMLG